MLLLRLFHLDPPLPPLLQCSSREIEREGGVWRRTRDDGLTARTVLVVDFVVASTRRGKHSPSRESCYTQGRCQSRQLRARDRTMRARRRSSRRHADGEQASTHGSAGDTHTVPP
ncbi:hypothetical protein HPB50_022635 [Hyalomma asiaticum]|uniref:Uncharacterized protein n=1 Tax=Hyalomma asiaticum TaxID=266040 RepID=A0ACB7RVX3_HYAAI|nr:hypothetical protein HPB50_022635 [Hyalomma asiaticum]